MKKSKVIYCPNCASKLMHEDLDSITIVKVRNKNSRGDYYPKCHVCKKELSMKKIK